MVFAYTLCGIAATVAICKEFESLGGRDVRNIWRANENVNGHMAASCVSKENDADAENKLHNALDASHRVVIWRRCLVLALIISVMTTFLYRRRSERLFVVSLFVNFTLLYVMHGYYNFHVNKVISDIGKENLRMNFNRNVDD